MNRLSKSIMVAVLIITTVYSCKCSSSNSKQKDSEELIVEEVVEQSYEKSTIGLWVNKIARDDSFLTLLYSKNEKQFYVHDELKNDKGTYYDKTSPVAVALQADGRYYITYENRIKDCYYVNLETGLLEWHCEGYNPETVRPKSYSAALFKLALEDKR